MVLSSRVQSFSMSKGDHIGTHTLNNRLVINRDPAPERGRSGGIFAAKSVRPSAAAGKTTVRGRVGQRQCIPLTHSAVKMNRLEALIAFPLFIGLLLIMRDLLKGSRRDNWHGDQ